MSDTASAPANLTPRSRAAVAIAWLAGAGKSGESFPNDKTSDQWFNKAQFAAYTEVGRRIAVTARTVPSHQELP